MKPASIKPALIRIVRPWPAEQPRPPVVRTSRLPANDTRPQVMKKLSA